jgi:transposase
MQAQKAFDSPRRKKRGAAAETILILKEVYEQVRFHFHNNRVLWHRCRRPLSVCALIEPDRSVRQREFANSASGHKELLVWLGKHNGRVRISLEATGIYSLDLDLDLALDAEASIDLAMLNPKLVNRFAQTLRRSKTDAADALVLAEYSQRMPFTAWQRPSLRELRLRTISRYIESLAVEQAGLKNRLSNAEGTPPRRAQFLSI